jgi:hypothetical protein
MLPPPPSPRSRGGVTLSRTVDAFVAAVDALKVPSKVPRQVKPLRAKTLVIEKALASLMNTTRLVASSQIAAVVRGGLSRRALRAAQAKTLAELEFGPLPSPTKPKKKGLSVRDPNCEALVVAKAKPTRTRPPAVAPRSTAKTRAALAARTLDKAEKRAAELRDEQGHTAPSEGGVVRAF